MFSIFHHYRHWRFKRWAAAYYKSHPDLAELIAVADSKSKSTGIGYQTNCALHDLVLKAKPKAILECGTGKSTFVIADALACLMAADASYEPMLVSVEHVSQWYESARASFPFDRFPFVDIILRPRRMLGVGFLRGSGYEDIPEHAYDFIFVDGPDVVDDEGRETCNLTFVDIVSRSDIPVVGVTDRRLSTAFAHRVAVGRENTTYFPYFDLSVTRPVSKRDFLIGKKMSLQRLQGFVTVKDEIPSVMIAPKAS